MARKRIEETRLGTFGNAKPYRPMSAESLRRVRAPEMLVEDLLPAGMVCGLTSYPGVGKTWLAMEIARGVATADKIMGEFPVRGGQSGVLFVGSDSSEADYARQWSRLTQAQHEAWEATFDPEDGNPPPSPFERIHFLIQSPFMLDNSDGVKRVIMTALDEVLFPRQTTVIGGERVTSDRGGCALIIMDTLSRLTIANQNDNTEMERVFANIRVICEVTGAAVLLLHHNSKATEFNDGADWRGAMSQIGALDSWIQLSSSKKDRGKIKAEFKKFRGITPSSFEYKQHVSDPERASVTYLGRLDGSFFGQEDLKTDLLAQFSDWKTLGAAEEEMWPSYSDHFTDRGKFKKACANRLKDLNDSERLERRMGQKGPKGRTPIEYRRKGVNDIITTVPTTSPTTTS
jgi:hypothetical protein